MYTKIRQRLRNFGQKKVFIAIWVTVENQYGQPKKTSTKFLNFFFEKSALSRKSLDLLKIERMVKFFLLWTSGVRRKFDFFCSISFDFQTTLKRLKINSIRWNSSAQTNFSKSKLAVLSSFWKVSTKNCVLRFFLARSPFQTVCDKARSLTVYQPKKFLK